MTRGLKVLATVDEFYRDREMLAAMRRFVIIAAYAGLAACGPRVDPSAWEAGTPVSEVLQALGRPVPAHHLSAPPDPDIVLRGHELVFHGKATGPGGAAGKPISAYFVCVDCHLTARDEPTLVGQSDPVARLARVDRDNLALLPGTSFPGITDRESWFNGDWASKPGWEAAGSARTDLRRAIRFCAGEVSQGRALENWEEDSILAYLTSLQWTLGDLELTAAELSALKSRALDPVQSQALVTELRALYSQSLPASFGALPVDVRAGYPRSAAPDARNGERIWARACLHCHGPDGASGHHFRNSPEVRQELAQKFQVTGPENLYRVIRSGTDPEPGKPSAYMPNFTQERMSDAMIEDLRAWLGGPGS